MAPKQDYTVVIAELAFFNLNEGFGYANPVTTSDQPPGKSLRLLASDCRQFGGCPERPYVRRGDRVTEQWIADHVLPAKAPRGQRSSRNRPTMVAMVVITTSKGPRAILWTPIPPRRTVADINRLDSLTFYVGRPVVFASQDKQADLFVSGQLVHFALSSTALEIELTHARGSDGSLPGKIQRRVEFANCKVTEALDQLTLTLAHPDLEEAVVVSFHRGSLLD